jgi:NADP-dependent 3-hydroxy acid dehydrogenase YdfG
MSSDQRSFDGAVAVVTGASSGIGRSVAQALARLGAQVIASGRSSDRLEEAGQGLEGNWISMPGDLRSESYLQRLQARAAEHALDVLVHAAAQYVSGSIDEVPAERLDELYETNVRAPYALTRALLPALRRRSGQVVFVNSSAVNSANPANRAAYTATKAALRALADAIRGENNALGVRVISIYPGSTATPMQEGIARDEGRPFRPFELLQPGDVARTILHALQLPRTAEVTDVHIRPMSKRSDS